MTYCGHSQTSHICYPDFSPYPDEVRVIIPPLKMRKMKLKEFQVVLLVRLGAGFQFVFRAHAFSLCHSYLSLPNPTS